MKKALQAMALSGAVASLALASCVSVNAAAGNSGRVPLSHLQSMNEGRPWAPLPPSVAEGTQQGVARDQARLYLSGVIDSGEGQQWCIAQSGLPPHEVDELLLSRLNKQMEADPASTGRNAAQWASAVLEEEFPCD